MSRAASATGALLFGIVCMAASPAVSADAVSGKDEAAEAYAGAAAAMDAGDRSGAGESFADFRRRYREHDLYWQASMMWARCAETPEEAIGRLREVAKDAPPATGAECELEIAHLLMMKGDFPAAEKAYAAWLKEHGADERAEPAAYWRGFSLKEGGRSADAKAAFEPLYRDGRQDLWRALAGLALADMAAAGKDQDAAHEKYVELTKESWAAAVRPSALLKAARTTSNAWKKKQFLRAVERDYPGSPEASEAARELNEPTTLRYGVQVGAFVKESGAIAEQKRFQKDGHPVVVVKRRQIGMELHAVIVGPYETRAAAESKKHELNRRGTKSAFITTF